MALCSAFLLSPTMLPLAKTQGTSPKVDKFSKQGTAEPLEMDTRVPAQIRLLERGRIFCIAIWTHTATQAAVEWNLGPVGRAIPKERRGQWACQLLSWSMNCFKTMPSKKHHVLIKIQHTENKVFSKQFSKERKKTGTHLSSQYLGGRGR